MADESTPKSPGELAFERYAAAVGNVNYAGEPLKPFHELSDTIKAGWEAAAPKPLVLNDYELRIIQKAYAEHRNPPGERGDVRFYMIGRLANALRIEVE